MLVETQKVRDYVNFKMKIPIVYHPRYKVSFFGLEKILHDFDTDKYEKIFNSICKRYNITLDDCYTVDKVSREDLLEIHSEEYLDSLTSTSVVADIIGVSLLSILTAGMIKQRLLVPMRYGTAGTIKAAELALELKWAINLSGGYHLARPDRGQFNCIYADVALAVKKLLKKKKVKKVLIVDLNNNQGTGHISIFSSKIPKADNPTTDSTQYSYFSDERVDIFDMYYSECISKDAFAKQFITYDIPLEKCCRDETYLSLLAEKLRAALDASRPDLVMYCAGTDIYEHDSQGELSISAQGIILRDEIVFSSCRERNISIAMVMSGGYTRDSAEIIFKSIDNLFMKNILALEDWEYSSMSLSTLSTLSSPTLISSGLNRTERMSMTADLFNNRIPIVYHPRYTVQFFGVEKVLHKFDLHKYERIFEQLSREHNFNMEKIFSPPGPATDEELQIVHTREYLESLQQNSVIARIAEVSLLQYLPSFLLQSRVLTPFRYATAGTLLAAELALEYGWAVNLSGGFHHAKMRAGEGFCFFADVPFAIKKLLRAKRVKKVLVVDLGASQGNGYITLYSSLNPAKKNRSQDSGKARAPLSASSTPRKSSFSSKKERSYSSASNSTEQGSVSRTDSQEIDDELFYFPDERVHILDIYNAFIYPQDSFARQFVTYDCPLRSGTADEFYLALLREQLQRALAVSRPELVFFNAGTDIYERDPIGELSISRAGILRRDEIVFELCRDYYQSAQHSKESLNAQTNNKELVSRPSLSEKSGAVTINDTVVTGDGDDIHTSYSAPVVMVLGGGYTAESTSIIVDSLNNLHKKGLISLDASKKVEDELEQLKRIVV